MNCNYCKGSCAKAGKQKNGTQKWKCKHCNKYQQAFYHNKAYAKEVNSWIVQFIKEGCGSTAAAVIEEGVGGEHWIKANQRIVQLKSMLKAEDSKYRNLELSDGDIKIANELLYELKNAVETAKRAAQQSE